VVLEYRQKYEALSEVLDAKPALLLWRIGMARLLRRRRKDAPATPRSNGCGLVGAAFSKATAIGRWDPIDTSEFLRSLSGWVESDDDFTFLSKGSGRFGETLAAMNQVLATYCRREGSDQRREKNGWTARSMRRTFILPHRLLPPGGQLPTGHGTCADPEGVPVLGLDHRFHDPKSRSWPTFIASATLQPTPGDPPPSQASLRR